MPDEWMIMCNKSNYRESEKNVHITGIFGKSSCLKRVTRSRPVNTIHGRRQGNLNTAVLGRTVLEMEPVKYV